MIELKLFELSDSEDEDVVFADPDAHIALEPGLPVELRVDPALVRHTHQDIAMVSKVFHDNQVFCFLVANNALIYYGARLIQTLSTFAVPRDLHETAVNLLSSHSAFVYIGMNKQWARRGPSLHYPKFHLSGTTLYVLLVPDRAWGLECIPHNIHTDPATTIPYPTLPHFAQSFLRTRHVGNLELLVDGQDLSMEWGEEHLDFGHHSRKRTLWVRTVDEKVKRIPREKPVHLYSTRFRRRTKK